jgi:NTE family protein
MPMDAGEVAGLVLSGGGALAAYEVGVLKALLGGESPATGYQALDPRVVTGTSSGAFNGAMLVSRWRMAALAAVEEMQRIWLEEVAESSSRCGANGVFRWRANPLNFFDFGCMVSDPLRFFLERAQDAAYFSRDFLARALLFARSRSPFEQRLLELLDLTTLISTTPFPALLDKAVDFSAFGNAPKVLRITATNWLTGDLEEFGNEELAAGSGALIIMASGAIPGFFPPVSIPPASYVDGGVLMNTPLSPAIRFGARILHVVYLDPDIKFIPLSDLRTTLGTLQRTVAITMATSFNRDIDTARRINEGLATVGRARQGVRRGGDAEALVRSAGQVLQREETAGVYHQLTIHRYHPPDLLGGAVDLLNFRRENLETLIERGYADAVAHDCAASGCVLPVQS